MKLKLHHVNLCTTDVPAMDEFYRDVLDMKIEPSMAQQRITDRGYPGEVSFVTDGTTQFHIAEKDLGIGFRTGQVVNPVERGHIAFRTDDIAAFKQRNHVVPGSASPVQVCRSRRPLGLQQLGIRSPGPAR